MAQLIDIFLQPGKMFSKLKESPNFWVPLLAICGLTALMTFWYFMTVDADWYADHALRVSGREMTSAEMEAAKQVMPGARSLAFFSAPVAAAGTALVYMIYALYFFLAGKVTGVKVSFKQAMALVCWANMPIALSLLVALVGIATMAPQSSLESMMLTNVDPLLVQMAPDSRWASLATGSNLLSLWVWFLLALSWRTWSQASWFKATVIALIPSVLVYAVMIAFVLSK